MCNISLSHGEIIGVFQNKNHFDYFIKYLCVVYNCMLNKLQDREGAGTAGLPGQARINVFISFCSFPEINKFTTSCS